MIILVFIVVIIGGLGSVSGCFLGALLVGLTANYVRFLAPKVALGSNIALMVAGPAVASARAAARWRDTSMLTRLLSGDRPAQPRAGTLLVALLVGLALAPFLFHGTMALQRRGADLHLHRACRQLRHAARLHRHRLLRAYHVLRHRRLWRGDPARARPGSAGAPCSAARVAALALAVVLAAGDRPPQPARARDLLLDDHAGGGELRPDPGNRSCATSPAGRTG